MRDGAPCRRVSEKPREASARHERGGRWPGAWGTRPDRGNLHRVAKARAFAMGATGTGAGMPGPGGTAGETNHGVWDFMGKGSIEVPSLASLTRKIPASSPPAPMNLWKTKVFWEQMGKFSPSIVTQYLADHCAVKPRDSQVIGESDTRCCFPAPFRTTSGALPPKKSLAIPCNPMALLVHGR